MQSDDVTDLYETLQISSTAEPDTIHRVYRLLAQRFHPDNRETGDPERFRQVTEAYRVLGTPESRAQYDVTHAHHRRTRWRLVTAGQHVDDDVQFEQAVRLTVLEVLYTHRRGDPQAPGLYTAELGDLTGRPREHLGFTIWYLVQKRFVAQADDSRIVITAEGVDHLERHYDAVRPRGRLHAGVQQ